MQVTKINSVNFMGSGFKPVCDKGAKGRAAVRQLLNVENKIADVLTSKIKPNTSRQIPKIKIS